VPRISRPRLAGLCAHVVTRGNARATVFHSECDYEVFVGLMKNAQERSRLELLAWCLMPNHLHLVVRSQTDDGLARWMHWLLTTHAQRHRSRYATSGHIWQGRYRLFPIQRDGHLLRVLRYVERNPVRAGLVASSREWRWSSLLERTSPVETGKLLTASPVPLPTPWTEWVDTPITDAELDLIRTSIRRGGPFGDPAWTRGTRERIGLRPTLRARGRPRNL
jgi:putative transposase